MHPDLWRFAEELYRRPGVEAACLQLQAQGADALAIMKTGRNLPRVRRALAAAGRLQDAWLVERGTMPDQRLARLVDVDASDVPYFAIVLVHGQGRRPEIGGIE